MHSELPKATESASNSPHAATASPSTLGHSRWRSAIVATGYTLVQWRKHRLEHCIRVAFISMQACIDATPLRCSVRYRWAGDNSECRNMARRDKATGIAVMEMRAIATKAAAPKAPYSQPEAMVRAAVTAPMPSVP
jgi:hypothetical protein